MKYIKRILCFLPILCILLVAHLWFAIKRSFEFLLYGGEYIQYSKGTQKTVQDVYNIVAETTRTSRK